jgi:hypothetical protein
MAWTRPIEQNMRDPERYASDLSDDEFALIQPLLPSPKRRGRKQA